MIDAEARTRAGSALTILERLEPEIAEEFIEHSMLMRFASGRDIMDAGDRVDAIPLVISGSIRVYQIADSGREITLYRFGAGECCVLSADSILGDRLFPARAQVLEDAEVVMVPARLFNDWLARSPVWREFVFGAMSQRLVSLMHTLDDVAFARLDRRIAALLARRTERGTSSLRITHQEIADELGSSREVVSRVLEDLQDQGVVRLSRGVIDILDRGRLTAEVA